MPIRYNVDVFSNVLPILGECSFLRNLAINGSSTDDVRAPMVTRIDNIDNLTIEDPTRAILQLLPDWLGRLSASLRGLYLLVGIPEFILLHYALNWATGQLWIDNARRAAFFGPSSRTNSGICPGLVLFTYGQ